MLSLEAMSVRGKDLDDHYPIAIAQVPYNEIQASMIFYFNEVGNTNNTLENKVN